MMTKEQGVPVSVHAIPGSTRYLYEYLHDTDVGALDLVCQDFFFAKITRYGFRKKNVFEEKQILLLLRNSVFSFQV